DFDLVAFSRPGGLQCRGELLLVGRDGSGDAEATIGAEHTKAAPVRTRVVDEKVDETVLGHRRLSPRRAQLEQRPLQLVDPRTRRAGDPEHAHDSPVRNAERGWIRPEVDLV